MKRLLFALSTLLLAAPLVCVPLVRAQDQGVSLGDAARIQQAKKGRISPNAKVYDNENIPKGGNISTTTGGAFAPTATTASASGGAAAAAAGSAAKSKDQSPEEAAKAQGAEFQKKVDEIKKNIAQLAREIDVIQREERLRAAAFYGDIGGKVRPENMAKAQADTAKYNDTLKAKQDELDAAKASLDQLREDIRKAGLPSSIGE